jgi:uncharacterized protein YqcC (DUF446 family)
MSSKTPSAAELFSLLDEIAHTLRETGLNTARPSDTALASTAPFCFDTLEFHAWLEWVFLPRIQRVIEGGLELAAPCNIAPLAEYQFATYEQPTNHLLALLTKFDQQANAYFDFPIEDQA